VTRAIEVFKKILADLVDPEMHVGESDLDRQIASLMEGIDAGYIARIVRAAEEEMKK
jgi:hypothetical protein